MAKAKTTPAEPADTTPPAATEGKTPQGTEPLVNLEEYAKLRQAFDTLTDEFDAYKLKAEKELADAGAALEEQQQVNAELMQKRETSQFADPIGAVYESLSPRDQLAGIILAGLLQSPVYAPGIGNAVKEREMVLKAIDLADDIIAFSEPELPQAIDE